MHDERLHYKMDLGVGVSGRPLCSGAGQGSQSRTSARKDHKRTI